MYNRFHIYKLCDKWLFLSFNLFFLACTNSHRVTPRGIVQAEKLKIQHAEESKHDNEKRTSLQQDLPVLENSFQISVKSDGKEVSHFEEPLVHRIVVTPEQINLITAPWPKGLNLPFHSQVEKNQAGTVVGFRLIEGTTPSQRGTTPMLLPTLGLKENDIITAVGAVHGSEIRDLWPLLEKLRKGKSVTLTLQRFGSPHKFIYYPAAMQDSAIHMFRNRFAS